MLKINKKIEYALMILKFMDKQPGNGLVNVKTLVEKFQISFDVTSRVMQKLSKNGILSSEQGAHGGYRLVKPLSEISFYDINRTLLGPIQFANCVHDNKCNITETCNIMSPVRNLNRKLVDLFKQISISDLTTNDKPSRIQTSREQISLKTTQ